MISIITGAKKNVGDFLIAHRAKSLIRKFVDDEIFEINRHKKIDDFLEKINQSKCLVLAGGPAYTLDIFPNIYDLANIIDDIQVPIIPFGLGWGGFPARNPNSFRFNETSLWFLKKIHANIQYSSCRDVITNEILHNHKITNVIMTGCPVWYDLDYVEKSFEPVTEIKKIVITTPASQKFLWETLKLIIRIERIFSKAEITLSFHRGILPGLNTPPRKGISYSTIALFAMMKGMKVKDVSGDLRKISFYNDCDLHIGYRVHAHLYFLSKRKPSILICEDGRGIGMVKSMKQQEFIAGDPNLLSSIDEKINQYLLTGFVEFDGIHQYIDDTFSNKMVPFLQSLR